MRQGVLISAIILLCCVSFAAANVRKWHQLEGYTFKQYVIDFSKEYKENSMEWDTKKANFEMRLAEIQLFNASTKGYRKGINRFSDMTDDERREQSFGRKKPVMQYEGEDEHKVYRKLANLKITDEMLQDLPDHVDWRTHSVVSPVKDQGHCGSCWAFSAVSTIESHAAIASGDLKTLSTEQLVDCVLNPDQCGGSGGCDGADSDLPYEYVAKYGITSEFKYSYSAYFGNASKCTYNTKTKTIEVSIEGYTKLLKNDYATMLTAVATIGPIDITIDASGFHDYESGVFSGCSQEQYVDLNHGVNIVGYGEDPAEGLYWLVRNSWGTKFGENGYIRVKRDVNPSCKMDITPEDGNACAGDTEPILCCGECGILYEGVYPTGAKVIG